MSLLPSATCVQTFQRRLHSQTTIYISTTSTFFQVSQMADLLGQVAQQLSDLQTQLTAAQEEIGRLTTALASKVRSTPYVEEI